MRWLKIVVYKQSFRIVMKLFEYFSHSSRIHRKFKLKLQAKKILFLLLSLNKLFKDTPPGKSEIGLYFQNFDQKSHKMRTFE